jgi:hypothetical protein
MTHQFGEKLKQILREYVESITQDKYSVNELNYGYRAFAKSGSERETTGVGLDHQKRTDPEVSSWTLS